VIGPDLTIMGNLESQGEIQIEGEVQGDINAARIVVGEGARITGSLLADNNIAGSIRGNNVTLQSNSRVEGDVFHRQVAPLGGSHGHPADSRRLAAASLATCASWRVKPAKAPPSSQL
jgi:hypothetical protein